MRYSSGRMIDSNRSRFYPARTRLPLLVHDDNERWVAGVSAGGYEDVHSRLTARLVKHTGDPQRDGEHTPGN
jgi:hypothetical protein